jgi:multiple antibiotic resistance protein
VLEFIANTFVVFFVVIDPIGLAAMFTALAHGGGAAYRRHMALRGTGLAAAILLAFFFVGAGLLRALGIGVPAFRIAGGVLLFLLAIDMVFARQSGLRSTTRQERAEAEIKEDISVFPLAFPLIAGPGALTTVLLMTAHQRGLLGSMVILLVLALVLGITLLLLLWSNRVMALLGETGTNVISRLLGLVLAALAVQYVMDGIRAGLAG